jgi:FtsK/SpoIIIE family
MARPVTRSNATAHRSAGWIATLHDGVIRPLWRWRVELLILAAPAALQRLLAGPLSDVQAALVAATGGVLVVWWPRSRRWVRSLLAGARVRRAWWRACVDAGLACPAQRGPRIEELRAAPAGWLLRVRVLRGQSADLVADRAELLAASIGLRDVRVSRDRANAALCDVFLVTHDPLAASGALPWPMGTADSLSVWQPIPVGVGEHGELVCVQLPERHLLVGGEPGAGKSVALSMIAATGALDPNCRLWLLDGKLVELAAWEPAAERLAGADMDAAMDVLEELRETMDARYRVLLDRGQRKVAPADGLPLHLLVCDELAFFVAHPDRKARQAFAELLRDLVARGRAAGVIVVAATQKPGSDVIPTSLRDLFGFRWALRCNTPQASDTILGQGWASQGWDASKVPASQRGVGLLLHEQAAPVRLRSFYLADAEIDAIARRAAALRGGGS